MSGPPALRTIGILPALGSGLTDLRRTGQHERLLNYDLLHYCEAYDRVYYFSYFKESLGDFTRDPLLLDKVTVLPRRGTVARPRLRPPPALPVPPPAPRVRGAPIEQFPGVIPALVARALYGIPFVVTYGYHYGEIARLAGSRLKPRLYRWLERVTFPRAAGVIVTSHEMEALLARHPPGRVSPTFPTASTRRASPRPRHHGPRTAPRTVLYVGRLSPEKNLARLIEALAQVRESPCLVLVGDGVLRGDLEERARAVGVEAEFLGVVPHSQLPRHFRSADCFVLPSLSRGIPRRSSRPWPPGCPVPPRRAGAFPRCSRTASPAFSSTPSAWRTSRAR
jgi:glycosyltransferase involved in cell wall biosynthesis